MSVAVLYSMLHRQKGSIAAEVALGSLVFFAVLITISDFGRMYHCKSRLKYAVTQATRFATTGNTVADPHHPGAQLSRTDSIKAMIRELSRFNIDDGDIAIVSIDSAGRATPGAGGPGDIVTVTATFRVDVVAPLLSALLGKYELSATTSFKNKDFPVAPLNPGAGMVAA